MIVANDSVRQSLLQQGSDGTFEDVALVAGVGYDENGKTFAVMGVDVADYDNDGYIDIIITALSNETYPLFRNNGDMSFTYATNTSSIEIRWTSGKTQTITIPAIDKYTTINER